MMNQKAMWTLQYYFKVLMKVLNLSFNFKWCILLQVMKLFQPNQINFTSK